MHISECHPQGLSSVLPSAAAINCWFHCPGMFSLYVDSFAIYYISDLPTIERQLQLTINWLPEWSQENNFKFYTVKTMCVYFSEHSGVFLCPSIFMEKNLLLFAETLKFLGLVLDNCLSWALYLCVCVCVCVWSSCKESAIIQYFTYFKWSLLWHRQKSSA